MANHRSGAAAHAAKRGLKNRKSVGTGRDVHLLPGPAGNVPSSHMSAHEALRRALEPFHTVVQECVVQRLLHGRSQAELAEKLALPQEQVRCILDKMRPWVTRFVGHFNDDRFWSEGPVPGQDGVTG
ncbi:MAG: hypothetical protein ABIK37_01665 [candidate division WOR-3 bacterium]